MVASVGSGTSDYYSYDQVLHIHYTSILLLCCLFFFFSLYLVEANDDEECWWHCWSSTLTRDNPWPTAAYPAPTLGIERCSSFRLFEHRIHFFHPSHMNHTRPSSATSMHVSPIHASRNCRLLQQRHTTRLGLVPTGRLAHHDPWATVQLIMTSHLSLYSFAHAAQLAPFQHAL